MFSHKCEYCGSDFQVFYIGYSSTDWNVSLDFQHLKMWTRRKTGEDVNQEEVTLQHCRVPLWLAPPLFGSCSDLWSPSSPSSHPSGCTAFLLFWFMVLSWKFWVCQDLKFLAFDAEPEVTNKREPKKRFCIVACIFPSHFCCYLGSHNVLNSDNLLHSNKFWCLG